MRIEFYKTVLCPRCLYVGRILKQLTHEFPNLELEEIEITTNLPRLRANAIYTVPAIKIGEDMLTGLLPTRKRIRDFIKSHAALTP